MGSMAHIQIVCPLCSQRTDSYLPNSGRERGNAPRVKCMHCGGIFTFGVGMAYRPVAEVAAMPDWAVEANKEAKASVSARDRLADGVMDIGISVLGGAVGTRMSPRVFSGCFVALFGFWLGVLTLFTKPETEEGRRSRAIAWLVIVLCVAAIIFLITRA